MNVTASPRIHAFLLAAGLGTRLRPLTDQLPKCLAPIHGRPILGDWLDALNRVADAGIALPEVRVNLHAHPKQVEAFLQRRAPRDRIRVTTFYEPTLLGSAGTLAANPNFADEADAVLVIYADNLSDVDLSELIAFHQRHPDPATMLLFHAENPRACGIVQLDEQNRILEFVEKPVQPRSNLANAGVYVFDTDLYREIAARQAFDLGHEVLPDLVGRMRGFSNVVDHRDIGTPESLAQARRDAPRVRSRLWRGRGQPRPALFLDRDGTLIHSVHHLTRPEQVAVLPGVADALQRFRRAGYVLVVVTNQSVIGRGLLDENDLERIHAAMNAQFEPFDAAPDAIYFCPAVPRDPEDRLTIDHPDRKPGPGLLLRAAREMDLDLSRSWMVGDTIGDLWAGRHAGCAGVALVQTGLGITPHEAQTLPEPVLQVANLAELAHRLLPLHD